VREKRADAAGPMAVAAQLCTHQAVICRKVVQRGGLPGAAGVRALGGAGARGRQPARGARDRRVRGGRCLAARGPCEGGERPHSTRAGGDRIEFTPASAAAQHWVGWFPAGACELWARLGALGPQTETRQRYNRPLTGIGVYGANDQICEAAGGSLPVVAQGAPPGGICPTKPHPAQLDSCLCAPQDEPAGPGPGSEADARSNGGRGAAPSRAGAAGAREEHAAAGNGAAAGGGGGGGGRDEQMLLAGHLVDFWTNICVCHSLIVDDSDDGAVHYQARLQRAPSAPPCDQHAVSMGAAAHVKPLGVQRPAPGVQGRCRCRVATDL